MAANNQHPQPPSRAAAGGASSPNLDRMLVRTVPTEREAYAPDRPQLPKWDKSGWLRKYTVLQAPMRVVTQLYKLRFFTLEGRILTYYKTEQDASLGFGRNRRGRFGVNNAMIHLDRLLILTDEVGSCCCS